MMKWRGYDFLKFPRFRGWNKGWKDRAIVACRLVCMFVSLFVSAITRERFQLLYLRQTLPEDSEGQKWGCQCFLSIYVKRSRWQWRHLHDFRHTCQAVAWCILVNLAENFGKIVSVGKLVCLLTSAIEDRRLLFSPLSVCLFVCLCVCLFVCLWTVFRKNSSTDFDETWWGS